MSDYIIENNKLIRRDRDLKINRFERNCHRGENVGLYYALAGKQSVRIGIPSQRCVECSVCNTIVTS